MKQYGIENRIEALERLKNNGRPKGRRELQCIERLILDLRYALENGAENERGIYWDEEAAEKTVEFFGYMRHWKGEWAKEKFELADWQEHCIVAPLFGWKRIKDGSRRFREAYVEIPRKNGKTTLAAGIALKCFVGDLEQGAEVYTAATKKDQAQIAFRDAQMMIRWSPELLARIQVQKYDLYCPNLQSVFRALSSEYKSMDGLNVHCGVIDELHAHRNRSVYDLIKTGIGSRIQPLIFEITTAGYDRYSICWTQRQHSVNILEGIFEDDTFFCFIACADFEYEDDKKNDDWRKEETWHKANPNLGVSKKWDYIRAQCKSAQMKPSEENTFKRLDLNVWTEQETRFIPMEKWRACPADLTVEQLAGRVCYGGLDLSTRYDLTASAWIFPPIDDSGIYDLLVRFYIPEENMRERIDRDRVPYDVWSRAGWVFPTPGNVVDYEYVYRDICGMPEKKLACPSCDFVYSNTEARCPRCDMKTRELRHIGLAEQYNIKEIAVDRWGASQLSQWLIKADHIVIEMGQGMASMNNPMKDMLGLILSKKIRHQGNPCFNWNVSAVTAQQDAAGNVKPVKPERDKSANRIDGFVAAIMALDRAMRGDADDGKSKYENEGIKTL